jgi:hypothetical protein
LVSIIFAIMVGYATVHAMRNDRCGETAAQVINLGRGDGIADLREGVRVIGRSARP